jgi:hypothetical protein
MCVCCGVARIVRDENRRAGPGVWTATGFSNGARLADRRGQRDLDIFAAATALSADVVPTRITTAARAAGIRHYLDNGTLEPGFRRATRDWAPPASGTALRRHDECVGEHDHPWWQYQLPTAVRWLRPSAKR